MGIVDSFCPKRQPCASQRTEKEPRRHPTIGLLARFEVESRSGPFAVLSTQDHRAARMCVFDAK
jgi:hypothetical protein